MPRSIQVPSNPAEHVVRRGVEPAGAHDHRHGGHIRKRRAIEIVALQRWGISIVWQRKYSQCQTRGLEHPFSQEILIGGAYTVRERLCQQIETKVGIQRAGSRWEKE